MPSNSRQQRDLYGSLSGNAERTEKALASAELNLLHALVTEHRQTVSKIKQLLPTPNVQDYNTILNTKRKIEQVIAAATDRQNDIKVKLLALANRKRLQRAYRPERQSSTTTSNSNDCHNGNSPPRNDLHTER